MRAWITFRFQAIEDEGNEHGFFCRCYCDKASRRPVTQAEYLSVSPGVSVGSAAIVVPDDIGLALHLPTALRDAVCSTEVIGMVGGPVHG